MTPNSLCFLTINHVCCCILAPEQITKVDFRADIQTLLELRGSKDCKSPDVTSDMRDLWEWYGLDLMSNCSRITWDWGVKANRDTKLFSDCVLVGDEALALQVLHLRGKYYQKLYEERKRVGRKNFKQPKGRKKAVEQDDKEFEATQKELGLYRKLYEQVKEIRAANNDGDDTDKFGWGKYLREKQWERKKDGSKQSPKKDDYQMMEIPLDIIQI